MSRMALFMLVGALACGLITACGDDDDGGTDSGRVDSGGDDAGGDDAGGDDAGGDDAGGDDAGGDDAGGDDAGSDDAGGVDSATDAGPVCEGMTLGSCEANECLGCPAGGPSMRYLCTTSCTSDEDCTDSDRPDCNQPDTAGSTGICAPAEFACAWGAICAAPDTPIATPDGDVAIANLREGDLVYSVDDDRVVVVPLVLVSRTAVYGHRVMEVTLDNGEVLEISPGHPDADGVLFGDFVAGHDLGGITVTNVREIPYEHEFTYDILPATESGTYFAGGAWIGSTLR